MMPVSMVGRADELHELVAAWARVASGRAPGVHPVVITAAAGLGKSMLVASALDAFRPRPRAVLSGAARVHTPAPYDWLAAVLSGRATDGLPVPADALAWLAQHPDAPTERYAPGALLRLAVRTVRALVGPGPVVLVVEDLHALDPASINLVGELAAAPDLPALLLVTSRPPEEALSPELAARALARLSGAPGAVRQHLGPLGMAEVRQILAQVCPGAPAPADVVRAVWRRTGGNPYWLTELLATAASGGLDALAREPLPEHVHLAAPAASHVSGSGTRPESQPGRRAPARHSPARPRPETTHHSGTPEPAPWARTGEAELTAREIEVLRCLAAGMSNKQVARSLGISIRTVAVHVSNLLRKTRSASRTEAALWAVQRQIPR